MRFPWDKPKPVTSTRIPLSNVFAGILFDGHTGEILEMNRLAHANLRYRQGELYGMELEDALVPARLRKSHREFRRLFMLDPQPRPMGADRVVTILKSDKDGRHAGQEGYEETPVRTWVGLQPTEDGNVLAVFVLPDEESMVPADAKAEH